LPETSEGNRSGVDNTQKSSLIVKVKLFETEILYIRIQSDDDDDDDDDDYNKNKTDDALINVRLRRLTATIVAVDKR